MLKKHKGFILGMVIGAMLFCLVDNVAARTGLYAPLSCKMYMVNFWTSLKK